MDIKEPVVNVIVCRCTDLCRQAPSRSIGDCRGPYIQWWLSPVPECSQGCRQTPPQLPLPTCYRCWSGYRTSQMVRSSGPAQRLSGRKKKKSLFSQTVTWRLFSNYVNVFDWLDCVSFSFMWCKSHFSCQHKRLAITFIVESLVRFEKLNPP